MEIVDKFEYVSNISYIVFIANGDIVIKKPRKYYQKTSLQWFTNRSEINVGFKTKKSNLKNKNV